MNNWNFTGNLARDAETRHTPAGDAVVQFSVGVKSGYGDKATTTWARGFSRVPLERRVMRCNEERRRKWQ